MGFARGVVGGAEEFVGFKNNEKEPKDISKIE